MFGKGSRSCSCPLSSAADPPLWGAQAASRNEFAFRILVGKLPTSAGWQPALPGKKQPRELFHRPHAAAILGQAVRYGLSIFAKDTFALHPIEFSSAIVIARFNSREAFRAVHHIRLEINHRASKNARRQQIARIHVSAR